MSPEWQRWKGIMKAVPFETKRLDKWQPPYIIQPKYDGDRCRAVKLDNGNFLLLSSNSLLMCGQEVMIFSSDDNSRKLPLSSLTTRQRSPSYLGCMM